jgi:hypothetical protein
MSVMLYTVKGLRGFVSCKIDFKAASRRSWPSRACYSAVFIATTTVGMKYSCPLSAGDSNHDAEYSEVTKDP